MWCINSDSLLNLMAEYSFPSKVLNFSYKYLGLPIVFSFYFMMVYHSYAFMYYGAFRIFY